MPLAAASRLGPYEILGPLGAGGMGEVYRARDARLGRDVAIKVLPSNLALDPVALARFERETRAVAALSHPNILAIFDVGQEGSVAFAVTELLEGETLRDRLRAGPLPLRKALEYGAQVAQGLAAAHAKGIVHRDLKPENVFLSPDGRAKVLDFGLAKPSAEPAARADESTLVVATDPGMVAGTPAYMAPEQVRAEPVSPQTDIFALGSLLFEMIAGQRAFQGQTPVETMTAVLREDPPDLATLVPAVPPAVAALVMHCLEKQTAERFQSARDVAFHLQSLAGTPTPSQPRQPALDDAAVVPERRRGPRRWLPAMLAAGLVLSAAAAFVGGWLIGHRPTATPRFTRTSFTPKVIYRAAFSPEKDRVIYSAAVDGNRPQLYQLGREYPSARPLALPADTHLLSISHTGELALLLDARIVTSGILAGTLARVPLGADAPRAVLDNVRDADWLGEGGELVVVRAAGNKDRLESPPGHVLYETDGYLSELRASPDGSLFAMFEHPAKWAAPASLVVIDRRGQKRVLAGEYAFARGLAWQPDGSAVVFGASAGGAGNTSILAVALDRGGAQVIMEAPGSLTVHDVSGTNEWLVSRDDVRVGIRAQAPGESAERELTWLDRSSAAGISADGRALLFTELAPPAGSDGSVCLRGTNGSPVVVLGSGVAQDLSPDGLWALAIVHKPPQLLLYPTGAGEKRTLPRGGIEAYHSARWFPDGRRILLCGAERGRTSRCYVQALDGTPPRPATDDGEHALVSPDGQKLLLWRAGTAPVLQPVAGGARTAIPGITAEDVPTGWAPDGRSVLVYRPRQVPGQADRIDMASGRRDVVRQFSPADHVGLLSFDPVLLSPDGTTYAYTYTRVLSTLFKVEFPGSDK